MNALVLFWSELFYIQSCLSLVLYMYMYVQDTIIQLAIAIVVVGSQRTEFFEAVFDILKEWKVSVNGVHTLPAS